MGQQNVYMAAISTHTQARNKRQQPSQGKHSLPKSLGGTLLAQLDDLKSDILALPVRVSRNEQPVALARFLLQHLLPPGTL